MFVSSWSKHFYSSRYNNSQQINNQQRYTLLEIDITLGHSNQKWVFPWQVMIVHSICNKLPEGKSHQMPLDPINPPSIPWRSPFSYSFPMIFPLNHHQIIMFLYFSYEFSHQITINKDITGSWFSSPILQLHIFSNGKQSSSGAKHNLHVRQTFWGCSHPTRLGIIWSVW